MPGYYAGDHLVLFCDLTGQRHESSQLNEAFLASGSMNPCLFVAFPNAMVKHSKSGWKAGKLLWYCWDTTKQEFEYLSKRLTLTITAIFHHNYFV